jgi:hypothetical protein
MFFGTFFNCKWPAKALQELFTDAKVIPDPEFKSFDLKSLRTRSPDEVQVEGDTMADRSVERLKK